MNIEKRLDILKEVLNEQGINHGVLDFAGSTFYFKDLSNADFHYIVATYEESFKLISDHIFKSISYDLGFNNFLNNEYCRLIEDKFLNDGYSIESVDNYNWLYAVDLDGLVKCVLENFGIIDVNDYDSFSYYYFLDNVFITRVSTH